MFRGPWTVFTACDNAKDFLTSRGISYEQIPQVEANPHVVILYRNPAKYQIPHMRLYGDATIYKTGEMRDKVMARVVQRELDQDPERKGYAVVVKVNRVRVGRNLVQERKV